MNGSSYLYRSGLWFCLIAATGVVSWHREKDNRLGRSDLAGFAFWRRARRVFPTVSTRWLNPERSKPTPSGSTPTSTRNQIKPPRHGRPDRDRAYSISAPQTGGLPTLPLRKVTLS